MEVQQLRHLIAAVQFGNLLRAAQECNISQSGLSRSIKSLETRLGVQLLLRKSKGVEPTIFGVSVIQRARIILNEVNRSVAEVRALESANVGDVAIGITQNYAHYFIPDILAEVHAARPDVRVTVSTGGFLDLLEGVRTGLLDFGFGLLGPMEETSELIVAPLREHHSRVLARRGHPLTLCAGEVTPEQLAGARWAVLSGEGFQRSFASYFSTRGLRIPGQTFKTDSIELIRKLIARADILTVLPPDVVLDQVEAGALVILDCDAPAEETQVGLIFRDDGLVTPQTKLIADRIRARLGR